MLIPDRHKDLFRLDPQDAQDARINPKSEPRAYAVIKTTDAWIFNAPDPLAQRISQMLFGESVSVHNEQNGFYQVQSYHDLYTGWVHGSLLEQVEAPPRDLVYRTHYAAAITKEPDMKSPLISYLAPDSRFAIEAEHGDYLKIPNKGWVHKLHTAARSKTFDIVQTAREHMGRSYVWGGRALAGLDCSALAQIAYRFAGYEIPRDSDLQRKYLTKHHKTVRAAELAAGDLIFTPGHVMIASGKDSVIHANAHHMRVVEEPFKDAVARIQTALGDKFAITACRW